MAMLMEKYTKLLELINNDTLTWIGHSGVPFIICTYEKNEHITSIDMIERLKVDIDKYKVEVINMEELIFNIIEEFETVDGIVELEKNEEIDIAQELSELILDEVRKYIVEKSKEVGENGRIIVTRVGATAIYFNFIRLLSYLEGKVRIPTIFFYPGKHDNYSVSLLNQYQENALRALII